MVELNTSTTGEPYWFVSTPVFTSATIYSYLRSLFSFNAWTSSLICPEDWVEWNPLFILQWYLQWESATNRWSIIYFSSRFNCLWSHERCWSRCNLAYAGLSSPYFSILNHLEMIGSLVDKCTCKNIHNLKPTRRKSYPLFFLVLFIFFGAWFDKAFTIIICITSKYVLVQGWLFASDDKFWKPPQMKVSFHH